MPTPWQNEKNLVRSLDFIEWATRSGYVRDYTSRVSPLTTAETTVLDLTVPDGSTYYAVESLVTVLGSVPCRQMLYGTPSGGKEEHRFTLVTQPESTDYRRLIRRKLPAGFRYRVAVAAPSTPKPKDSDRVMIRWTFLEVPWVDEDIDE